MHRREIALSRDSLVFADTLSADPGGVSRIRFHFHPDCRLERDGVDIRILLGAAELRVTSDAPLRLEESWYCPEFGLRIRNRAVVADLSGVSCRTRFDLVKGIR